MMTPPASSAHIPDLPLPLREIALLADVPEPTARQLLREGFRFRYDAGTPLVTRETWGETLFILLSGVAKLVIVSPNGHERHLTVFRAGEFFGELAILEPRPLRTAHVIAVTEVDVLAIHARVFMEALQREPMLGVNLARWLGRRLRAMNDRLSTPPQPDDIHKVAYTLLNLVPKGTHFTEAGAVLLPPLTLNDWALFCETPRQRLLELLAELKEARAVEWRNQRIAVIDVQRLEACAQVHAERLHL